MVAIKLHFVVWLVVTISLVSSASAAYEFTNRRDCQDHIVSTFNYYECPPGSYCAGLSVENPNELECLEIGNKSDSEYTWKVYPNYVVYEEYYLRATPRYILITAGAILSVLLLSVVFRFHR